MCFARWLPHKDRQINVFVIFFFTLQTSSGPLRLKTFWKMLILAFEENNTTSLNYTFFRILAHCWGAKIHNCLSNNLFVFYTYFSNFLGRYSKSVYNIAQWYYTAVSFKWPATTDWEKQNFKAEEKLAMPDQKAGARRPHRSSSSISSRRTKCFLLPTDDGQQQQLLQKLAPRLQQQ